MVDYGFYSTKKNQYTDFEIQNIKTFIDSKLIKYIIWNWSNNYLKKHTFDFLRELPEINLNKKWSDDELYKQFNITENEITKIEKWYDNWKP